MGRVGGGVGVAVVGGDLAVALHHEQEVRQVREDRLPDGGAEMPREGQ